MAPPRKENCDMCSQKSNNMEELNKHMEFVHQETPHERIERLTRTFQSMVNQTPESITIQSTDNPKLFDCSECGLIFSTNNEQRIHDEKYHAKTTFRINETVDSNIKKIFPDQEFLTSNTSDLKAILEAYFMNLVHHVISSIH